MRQTTIKKQIKRNRCNVAPAVDDNYERAKNIATILSAIAIPIILTIAGYFIQRQISDDGLKKDYVAIAANILKEDPKNQEPDLRVWAVKVLDDNSPVPFSNKAKEGLMSGIPVIVPGPAWLGPLSVCRIPPKERDILKEYQRLTEDVNQLDHDEAVEEMIKFIEKTVESETEVQIMRWNLMCLQDWVDHEEESDIKYRESIGATSSKSVFEESLKEKAAAEEELRANLEKLRLKKIFSH